MLAKPQAERKHDSSYTYGAAPTPAPFALPTFGGFAAPAYGAMGSGLGIAGSFSQVRIYVLKKIHVCHLIILKETIINSLYVNFGFKFVH